MPNLFRDWLSAAPSTLHQIFAAHAPYSQPGGNHPIPEHDTRQSHRLVNSLKKPCKKVTACWPARVG